MTLQRWHAILVVLAFAPVVFADGIIMPPVMVTRLPDMPVQRGLIVYRDGVEKLVVESPFEGEGDELAWLLPVPSEPVEIGKASAGIFTTLEMGLQPNVVEQNIEWHPLAVFLIAWTVLIFVSGRFVPFKALPMAVIITVAFVLGTGYGARMLARHQAMEATMGESSANATVVGVRASEVKRVGSYDVQTLEADSSADLDEWLSSNGYHTFPEAGAGIVDDYIGRNWKFVAAKLHREGNGFSRPHPLAVTFKTESAVYPMRLTQLAGSDLRLDLFVMADGQVSVENMTTRYSDRFNFVDGDGYRALQGRAFGRGLYLPSLADMAGGDCVITWLQADLPNVRLDADLAPVDTPESPTCPSVYTAQTVAQTARSRMVLAVGVVFAVGALLSGVCRGRRSRAVVILATLAVSVVCAEIVNAATHTQMPSAQLLDRQFWAERPADDVLKLLNSYPDVLARMSRDDVEAYLRDALKDARNPYTGEPISFEEAPCDVVIGSDEGGVFIRRFAGPFEGTIGAPFDVRITGEPIRPPIVNPTLPRRAVTPAATRTAGAPGPRGELTGSPL